MFINDNGAIYPIYVPNLSENTKIQEVWNEASAILGTRYFDLYYNGQKLSLDKSFKRVCSGQHTLSVRKVIVNLTPSNFKVRGRSRDFLLTIKF